MYQFRLASFVVLRHFARITTRGFRLFLFLFRKRHLYKLRSQACYLLFHRRAHVERFDHATQTLRGGDRLQARHARAQHQRARGFHCAGSGHQHREETLIGVGCQNHCLVAADVRLRREHVHALRAGDARQKFHRESGEPVFGVSLDLGHLLRRQQAYENAVLAHHRQFRCFRPAHLQHDF